MELTREQLKQLLPKNPYLDYWYSALSQLLPDYEINTPQRIAAFVAQCAHESGGFKAIKENLNYRPASLVSLFKKYFDLQTATEYCAKPNKQEAIANRIYANRMGNGAPESGDGYRFRGRGPIQLTGRANYTAFAKEMFEDWENVVNNPDWVTADRDFALMSAIWFWNKNKLNHEADIGDIKTMTRKINGGYIGLEDRIKHYNECIHLLT